MSHYDRAVTLDNGTIFFNGVAQQVLFADLNVTASGDTTVVAAVSDKKIRVVSIVFSTDTQTSVGWKSNSTILIQPMAFAQYGGMAINDLPYGFFVETVAGEALVANLTGTAAVRGSLLYALI